MPEESVYVQILLKSNVMQALQLHECLQQKMVFRKSHGCGIGKVDEGIRTRPWRMGMRSPEEDGDGRGYLSGGRHHAALRLVGQCQLLQ